MVRDGSPQYDSVYLMGGYTIRGTVNNHIKRYSRVFAVLNSEIQF